MSMDYISKIKNAPKFPKKSLFHRSLYYLFSKRYKKKIIKKIKRMLYYTDIREDCLCSFEYHKKYLSIYVLQRDTKVIAALKLPYYLIKEKDIQPIMNFIIKEVRQRTRRHPQTVWSPYGITINKAVKDGYIEH